MSMTMDSWKKKRDEWTKVRDAAKIKKGAVGSVSIGGDLDKIYEASKKGYRSLLAAIATAEKDIKTYQAKGGKAVEPVKDWLKKLGEDLEKLKEAAEADAKLLAKMGPRLVEFHQLAVPGFPDSSKVGDTVQATRTDAGEIPWLDAAKETNLYATMPEVLKRWGETITYLKGVSFKLTLPGKEAKYQALLSQPPRYEKGLGLLKTIAGSKSAEEHLTNTKAATSHLTDVDVNLMQEVAAPVKSLMG